MKTASVNVMNHFTYAIGEILKYATGIYMQFFILALYFVVRLRQGHQRKPIPLRKKLSRLNMHAIFGQTLELRSYARLKISLFGKPSGLFFRRVSDN
jgi:hypothetical protein